MRVTGTGLLNAFTFVNDKVHQFLNSYVCFISRVALTRNLLCGQFLSFYKIFIDHCKCFLVVTILKQVLSATNFSVVNCHVR